MGGTARRTSVHARAVVGEGGGRVNSQGGTVRWAPRESKQVSMHVHADTTVWVHVHAHALVSVGERVRRARVVGGDGEVTNMCARVRACTN